MSNKNIGKIEIQPANKGAMIFYTIFSLIFLGLGVLCFVLLYMSHTPEIEAFFDDMMVSIIGVGATIAQYWWVLVIIVVVLIFIGFFVGWLLLFLVAKIGHILVYAGCIVYIVGAIIGVVLTFIFSLPLAVIIGPIIPAVILLITMITNRDKLKRAGEFMKFTGQVVLAEKGMILAPLFVTFVSILTGLSMASIFAYLALLFQGDLSWLGYVLGSLAVLIQLIVYYGIFYVAEAINTTYAYEWYRKRDPDMKFCIKNVAGVYGPILTFGIVTAIISWVQTMLRNAASSSSGKGNWIGLILAIFARLIASILGFIYKYLTYFTLPAIVVEGRKFKDGLMRSFDLIKRYYLDVLIRETGVNRGMAIVQWISIFIYALLGLIAGLILWSTGMDPLTAMLVCIIPAIIFANIPTFFIFRPMNTAYLTFMFAYAQDEETNFRLPTRIPAEVRGTIKEASTHIDPAKSIARLQQ